MTKKPNTIVTIFVAGALKPLFRITSEMSAKKKAGWIVSVLSIVCELELSIVAETRLTASGEQYEVDWRYHSSIEQL